MAVAFVAVAAGFVIRKRQSDAFERVIKWLKGSRQVVMARRVGPQTVEFELEEGVGDITLRTYAGARGDGLRLAITVPLSRELSEMVLTPRGLVGNSDGVLTGDSTFDGKWLLMSGRPDAARLTFGPSARSVLKGAKLTRIEIGGRRLVLSQDDGVPSVPLMVSAFRLARALTGGTWRRIAEDLGLTMEGESLAGVIEGYETRIRLWGGKTRVVVAVAGHGLTAIHKAHANFRGVTLGNPVLDGLLALNGDPALLKELLEDEELIGPLLEVVHGHPGSVVSPSGVTLEVPGVAGEELRGLVAQALCLARALSPDQGPPVS
ncbi:MAG TPA: hypothetical protein QGF58_03155 [Myxococcota bacterium]|nr:hypothetical protein [Myxococcota bacterium]